MPIYEYECKSCHHRFEKIQKFSDPHVQECPKCGGEIEQVITAPAVQFKGEGWYVTDYAKKSSTGTSTGADSSVSKKDDKPTTDTKPETKTETKTETKAAETKS